jgi:hypothetical protein
LFVLAIAFEIVHLAPLLRGQVLGAAVDRRSVSRPTTDRFILIGLGLLLPIIVAAMAFLAVYKATAGEEGLAPMRWPEASRIARSDRPTLIMFAHPRCACTRASLHELRELMSEFGGRARVHVLFGVPEGAGAEWTESELWWNARSIEGVAVTPDVREREAQLFGARTSGYVVLYDANGRLLFSGGITGARGHVGDNAGLERAALRLNDPTALPAIAPAFGCPLADPT